MPWTLKDTPKAMTLFHYTDSSHSHLTGKIQMITCKTDLLHHLEFGFSETTILKEAYENIKALNHTQIKLRESTQSLPALTISFPGNAKILNLILEVIQKTETFPENIIEIIYKVFKLHAAENLKSYKESLEERLRLLNTMLSILENGDFNKEQEFATKALSIFSEESKNANSLLNNDSLKNLMLKMVNSEQKMTPSLKQETSQTGSEQSTQKLIFSTTQSAQMTSPTHSTTLAPKQTQTQALKEGS